MTQAPGQLAIVESARGSAERDGFEDVVRQQAPQLLRIARHMLKDEEAARDVVQDALLAATRALPRFQHRAALTTWLHRIVVNAALMHLRRARRRPEQSIDSLLPAFAPESAHVDPPLPWHIEPCATEQAETRALVRTAIDQLPDSMRNVVLLRDIEGLDTGQAAQLLGVTANAVKIRLHRARTKLRGLLEHRLDGTTTRLAAVDPVTPRASHHVFAFNSNPVRRARSARRAARTPRTAA